MRTIYAKRLIKEGVIDEAGVNQMLEERVKSLWKNALARSEEGSETDNKDVKIFFSPKKNFFCDRGGGTGKVAEIDGSQVELETLVGDDVVKRITQQISVVPEGGSRLIRKW